MSVRSGCSQGNELELRCVKVAHAAHKLDQDFLRPFFDGLRPQLRKSDPETSKKIYAVNGRLKSEKEILSKVLRRRAKVLRRRDPGDLRHNENYEPEMLDDAIGYRIVGLFRFDLRDLVEMVIKVVSHEIALGSNPFVAGEIKEIQVYASDINDPFNFVKEIESFVKNAGYGSRLKPTKHLPTEYSSIHLVLLCDCDDGWNSKKGKSVSPDKKVQRTAPVEVQLRTVFEDAWGEVQHKLDYEVSRANPGSESDLKDHLKALKTFADGCARYSDVLGDAAGLRRPPTGPLHKRPHDNFRVVMACIGKLPQGIVSRLRKAYRLRDKAMPTQKAD